VETGFPRKSRDNKELDQDDVSRKHHPDLGGFHQLGCGRIDTPAQKQACNRVAHF
jgi:hypothetical protein